MNKYCKIIKMILISILFYRYISFFYHSWYIKCTNNGVFNMGYAYYSTAFILSTLVISLITIFIIKDKKWKYFFIYLWVYASFLVIFLPNFPCVNN